MLENVICLLIKLHNTIRVQPVLSTKPVRDTIHANTCCQLSISTPFSHGRHLILWIWLVGKLTAILCSIDSVDSTGRDFGNHSCDYVVTSHRKFISCLIDLNYH